MMDSKTSPEPLQAKLAALRPRLQTYLPPDLASLLDQAQAPSPDDLLKMVQALNSLHHNLVTYLPRPLILSQPKPGVPRGELLEGTILFADVTGFTPLAERLRAMGEEGAERLNRMINGLFTALLDPLSRSRGELIIFAGDAVLAYFPSLRNDQDAIWAARSGLRMARAIEPFDQGPTPLSMSVGLAHGRFFAAQIGTAERMEYLVTGGPIQKAIKAEEKAAPRQVSLSPGLERLLGDQLRLAPLADGYQSVVDDLGDDLGEFELSGLSARRRYRPHVVIDRDPLALLETIDAALNDIETLGIFFPPDVLRRIVAHQRERQFPGEHRLVAVMFVNLRGFEALVEALGSPGLPQLTEWINRYFIEAQETLAGCGGLVTHVDPFSKGFTLLCPFGAPLADEETPHRATAAALRLNEKLHALNEEVQAALREQLPDRAEQLQLVHHIGITYGPIYTGQVGWRERREYVVVGDDVNLSARLMNKSQPNQILISGWVHDRVRQAFECHPLEPMKLKGKVKPVTVYAVERRMPASAWLVEAAVGPLVGREEELTTLESALEALEEKRGGVLTLSGETGMGKTRLVAELARRVRYWDVELLAGRCLSYAQATPFTPWVESLWRWFELDTAADKTERRHRVQEALQQLRLGKMAETICNLLGLPQDDAQPVPAEPTQPKPQPQAQGPLDLYALLTARVEQVEQMHQSGQMSATRQNLHLTLAWRLAERYPDLAADLPSLWEYLGQVIRSDEALLTLFQEIAQQNRPVLFLVEDLQWADHASWAALVKLAEASCRFPILLLVTTRSGEGEKSWRAELDERVCAQDLNLTGLSWADTGKLAAQLVRAREVAPELVSWLHQRAQGNPLFASQLLKLAGAEGLHMDEETGRVTLSKTPPSIPVSVREIMLSRVDQLSEETRTVIKLVSVIGDTATWELLTHLWRETGISEARLIAHLKDLAERSLLTPEPPAAEFSFVHPLLREAVYSSLPYAQRRQWHRAIADDLAQGDAETIYQRLEALAYHYKQSDTPTLGVRYNRLAGDKARARQAWDEARDFYQDAALVAGLDANLAQERSLAYERLGDVYALTDRYIEAAAVYEGALVETPSPARVEGKLGLVCPLFDCVDEAVQRMQKAWDELELEIPLRPWMAAALGWVALRARPTDMTAVARAGADAIAWFRRGQRMADSETAQIALKEMMAGRVPAQYSRLVHLALNDCEEQRQ